jgi:hypothetical protein
MAIFACLRRGLRLKDGPGSARGLRAVCGWGGFILSPSARTGLADLPPRVKVGQKVGCSTFTRGGRPATRTGGRRREDEPPGRSGCTHEQRWSTRRPVAVWVAVHHRAMPSREDRSAALVQPEPIRMAATRAAHAVGVGTVAYGSQPVDPWLRPPSMNIRDCFDTFLYRA